ncbi:GNAT family N-acetyltransferase [Aminipila butyrica]|nr:GNAT family N-acetyltransferase [Aminipila butyrica]
MIRKAVERDLAGIAGIYEAIIDQEEKNAASIGWKRGVYPTEDTARQALNRGDLYVMEADGQTIVGSAIINQVQVAEYANCPWQYPAAEKDVLVLHTLVVDPAQSKNGCGRSFVNFYEELAREAGIRYLRMDTNVRNEVARAFYRKMGYKEPGIVSCVFNGIEGVQLVCLEKKLEEVI